MLGMLIALQMIAIDGSERTRVVTGVSAGARGYCFGGGLGITRGQGLQIEERAVVSNAVRGQRSGF